MILAVTQLIDLSQGKAVLSEGPRWGLSPRRLTFSLLL